jgi:hypothetical protein
MLVWLAGPEPAMTTTRSTVDHTMADETAVQRPGPGWGTFQWIVGGLVAVIAVLVGIIYNDMRSSIRDTAEGLSTFKIEVARQFGEVARQFSDLKSDLAVVKAEVDTKLAVVKAAVDTTDAKLAVVKAAVDTTNAKLDKVIDRLDRPRAR